MAPSVLNRYKDAAEWSGPILLLPRHRCRRRCSLFMHGKKRESSPVRVVHTPILRELNEKLVTRQGAREGHNRFGKKRAVASSLD